MKKQKNIELFILGLLSEKDQEFCKDISKKSVYPFNKMINILVPYAISKNLLSFNDYLMIVEAYSLENQNMPIFEFSAPRSFGETFGQEHIKEKFPQILDPKNNKNYKEIDPDFVSQYDLYMPITIKKNNHTVRIESKASRAINKNESKGSFSDRGLFFNDTEKYDMNFQQLKPGCCDVFIFIGVWLDKIKYWVLSADEVQNHDNFSNQHRGSEKREDGVVVEGQLHIKPGNIHKFDPFLVESKDLESTILKKYKKQKGLSD